MRIPLTTLLVAAGVIAIVSCGSGGEAAPTLPLVAEDYPAEVLDLGAEVYDDTCSVCHGRQGKGGIGADLTGVAGRLPFEEHVLTVRTGKGTMPAFSGTLTPDEIEAVVSFQRVGLG